MNKKGVETRTEIRSKTKAEKPVKVHCEMKKQN